MRPSRPYRHLGELFIPVLGPRERVSSSRFRSILHGELSPEYRSLSLRSKIPLDRVARQPGWTTPGTMGVAGRPAPPASTSEMDPLRIASGLVDQTWIPSRAATTPASSRCSQPGDERRVKGLFEPKPSLIVFRSAPVQARGDLELVTRSLGQPGMKIPKCRRAIRLIVCRGRPRIEVAGPRSHDRRLGAQRRNSAVAASPIRIRWRRLVVTPVCLRLRKEVDVVLADRPARNDMDVISSLCPLGNVARSR